MALPADADVKRDDAQRSFIPEGRKNVETVIDRKSRVQPVRELEIVIRPIERELVVHGYRPFTSPPRHPAQIHQSPATRGDDRQPQAQYILVGGSGSTIEV